MHISKFRALIVVTLFAIICIGSVIALQVRYIIPSSGSIRPPGATAGGNVLKSEIRAMFMHSFSMINPDMELIAENLINLNVNTLIIELLGNTWAHYPSAYIPSGEYVLQESIDATHARGMELHVSMNVMLSALGDEYRMVTASGSLASLDGQAFCPTKQVGRTLLQNLIGEILQYDIDGFMFDYVRYDGLDVCYCPECKAAFEQYLGETIPDNNWAPNIGGGGDFAPGGSRYDEFNEWRTHPINDLVRDMRSWLLAAKPDLEISAAVWGWEPTAPAYNKYWIGQDSAYWVKEGYLDWVSPMVYGMTGSTLQSFIQGYIDDMVAGPEGKIPLVPFISNVYPSTVTPATFKGIVDLLRQLGTDGWAIWRYGGPGDGEGSGTPDIANYLGIIDMPNVFTLEDIDVSVNDDVTITWTTNLPATSKVEYNITPLFTASFTPDPFIEASYWDINHDLGTIIEDTTPVTNHNVILTGLSPGTKYYYRVQSQDASGIATSKVYTFMTSGS